MGLGLRTGSGVVKSVGMFGVFSPTPIETTLMHRIIRPTSALDDFHASIKQHHHEKLHSALEHIAHHHLVIGHAYLRRRRG